MNDGRVGDCYLVRHESVLVHRLPCSMDVLSPMVFHLPLVWRRKKASCSGVRRVFDIGGAIVSVGCAYYVCRQ